MLSQNHMSSKHCPKCKWCNYQRISHTNFHQFYNTHPRINCKQHRYCINRNQKDMLHRLLFPQLNRTTHCTQCKHRLLNRLCNWSNNQCCNPGRKQLYHPRICILNCSRYFVLLYSRIRKNGILHRLRFSIPSNCLPF